MSRSGLSTPALLSPKLPLLTLTYLMHATATAKASLSNMFSSTDVPAACNGTQLYNVSDISEDELFADLKEKTTDSWVMKGAWQYCFQFCVIELNWLRTECVVRRCYTHWRNNQFSANWDNLLSGPSAPPLFRPQPVRGERVSVCVTPRTVLKSTLWPNFGSF